MPNTYSHSGAKPEGVLQAQEFHRKLFANAIESFREEIKRITGVAVREAAAEIETATGTVVRAFSSGTMGPGVFAGQGVPDATWHGPGHDEQR